MNTKCIRSSVCGHVYHVQVEADQYGNEPTLEQLDEYADLIRKAVDQPSGAVVATSARVHVTRITPI